MINRLRNRLLQRTGERRRGLEIPHSGQDNFIRPGDHLRIVSDARLVTQMIKRLSHRCEISSLVIHDCDHKSPFVLGSKRAMRLSRQQAARNARENALNRASIL